MKKTTFVLSLVLLTLLASVFGASAVTSFTVDGACASTAPPVCDIGGNTYKTIQGAIDAATAGDTINIAAGTYEEQILIDKDLTLAGAGSTTIIQAPAIVPTCAVTSYDWHAIVCITNDATVDISDLTVDGAGLGNSNYKFMGIAFRNATGSVDNLTIRDIRDTPFSGAQHGVGLNLYNDDAASRAFSLTDTVFTGFQKNAMAIATGGTSTLTVNIDGNDITGAGATTVTAQNGVQVYEAAGTLTGTINNNTVDGIGYDNTTDSTKWVATSILNFYSDVDITNNVVTGGHVSVYNIDGTGTIAGNDFTVEKIGVSAWGIIATDPPAAVPAPYEETAVAAYGLSSLNAASAAASTLVVDIQGNSVIFSGGDNTDTFGIEADAGYGPDNLSINAAENTVSGFDVGFDIYACQSGCDTGVFTGITVNFNAIEGNNIGMRSNVPYLTVDATKNWWGDSSGPYNATTNPLGTGDPVSDGINYDDWLITPIPWAQGFETLDTVSNYGWIDDGTDTIARVPSGGGANAIPSASGAYHAEVTNTATGDSIFTRFAGYSTWFPVGGYTTEMDVYLDPAWASATGFDYTVAANRPSNSHLRDFIFHVWKDSSTGKLFVAASNNTNYAPREDLESVTPNYEVTTAGWYTLQHYFHDVGGVLAVDMNLVDSGGATVFTTTRTDPGDKIPFVAGGNRYGWFTAVVPSQPIAFDNVEICLGAGPCLSTEMSTDPADELLLCGTLAKTVTIAINDAIDMYGYQLTVSGFSGVATASNPTFIDTFFTLPTQPDVRSASCGATSCSFFVSRLSPSLPASGSGDVVSLDLTAIAGAGGIFDLTFDYLLLSDIDGTPISVDQPDPPLGVSVCGQVDITGNVRLQGRATPMNSGTVRLIDTDGNFGPYTATFDANGDYSFSNVDALPGGSNYRFEAAHDLYISNADDPVVITPGTYTTATTRLLGGDADLLPDSNLGGVGDQKVEVTDIACIASFFGPSAAPCGGKANSSTDINNDTITNIQDLSIAGGNYFKYSFLPW